MSESLELLTTFDTICCSRCVALRCVALRCVAFALITLRLVDLWLVSEKNKKKEKNGTERKIPHLSNSTRARAPARPPVY